MQSLSTPAENAVNVSTCLLYSESLVLAVGVFSIATTKDYLVILNIFQYFLNRNVSMWLSEAHNLNAGRFRVQGNKKSGQDGCSFRETLLF